MSSADAERWNSRYRDHDGTAMAAAQVLSENLHLLPTHGTALDLAAGLGGNALLLAHQGFETHAWDIASEAIERLQHFATQQGVTIHTQQRDIVAAPPPAATFDIIVVSRFLDRALCPYLAEALKANGLLFYQTYCVDSRSGPTNPLYRLQRNELLALFSRLDVIFYREEAILGPHQQEAMLIARHP